MSVEALEEVIERERDDPTFRRQLAYEPDAALHGYDITIAEREALVSGDEVKLRQLGVSPELSRLAGRFNQEESHTP
ncbi:MAG: hypothetical protein ACRDFS_08370 [Chloroflexota bacterium]